MDHAFAVAESRRTRRLVGRIDHGAELLAALAEICRRHGVRAGEVRALGRIEDAELGDLHAQRGGRPTRRFASAFTVVQLVGNVSEVEGRPHVEATCTLAREGDNGIELLGGRLVRARVSSLEFVIDCFEDLALRRRTDAATGVARLEVSILPGAGPGQATTAAAQAEEAPRAAVPNFEAPPRGRIAESPQHAPPPDLARARPLESATANSASLAARAMASPAEQAEPTWAEVAAASSERPPIPAVTAITEIRDRPSAPGDTPRHDGDGDGGADHEDALPDLIREGDVIDHPRFGRCEVERIEGDSEYAQVRLRNRRLVRLSLDILQLSREGFDERGHRRFVARVGG